MNYAKIDPFEYCNGEGIGVSLFVSGCNFHCNNCFNKEAWDFSYGSLWSKESEDTFIKLLNNEHIKRVSILGGEPLCDENIKDVTNLLLRVKREFPHIKIWIYTGYTAEVKNADGCTYFWLYPESKDLKCYDYKRMSTIGLADVLVDGQYKDNQRDLSLKFKGSKNQRIIDVSTSLKEGKITIIGE